jgi:uncharacterized protein (UPF0261 family)
VLNDQELAETGRLTPVSSTPQGPCAPLPPPEGQAYPDSEGLGHWDPESDRAFYKVIKDNLDSRIPVTEIDAHINDPEFIDPVVEKFLSFMEGRV